MTLSDKNGVLETLDSFATVSASDSEGAPCDPKPLEALRRAVRGLFELARRSPRGGAYLLVESGRMENESESSSAFEALSRHMHAAQSAGEIKAGDVSLMTTLIACTVIGTADLAQYPRATPGTDASGAEIPALLLLDLLATKRGDREERAPCAVRPEGRRSRGEVRRNGQPAKRCRQLGSAPANGRDVAS